MEHRHLNHDHLTLAMIDDLIERGCRADWERLRQAVLAEPDVRKKVCRVCAARVPDPYAQRYHLWMRYVEQRTA